MNGECLEFIIIEMSTYVFSTRQFVCDRDLSSTPAYSVSMCFVQMTTYAYGVCCILQVHIYKQGMGWHVYGGDTFMIYFVGKTSFTQ